jgi:hypothetical protein
VEEKMFDDKYIKDTIELVRYKMNLYWTSSGCHKHGKKTVRCYGHNAAWQEEAVSIAKRLIKEYPQTKDTLSDILGEKSMLLEETKMEDGNEKS